MNDKDILDIIVSQTETVNKNDSHVSSHAKAFKAFRGEL